MRKSLGLMEIRGLAGAIRVADTMAKSASVEMLGIETARGGGWMTVTVQGDVAAVQSSLASGSELARQLGCFVGQVLLSRPDEQVTEKLFKIETATDSQAKDSQAKDSQAKNTQNADKAKTAAKQSTSGETTSKEPVSKQAMEEEGKQSEEEDPEQTGEDTTQTVESSKQAGEEATCNLCGDPACTRMRGEPRANCLHNKKGK